MYYKKGCLVDQVTREWFRELKTWKYVNWWYHDWLGHLNDLVHGGISEKLINSRYIM